MGPISLQAMRVALPGDFALFSLGLAFFFLAKFVSLPLLRLAFLVGRVAAFLQNNNDLAVTRAIFSLYPTSAPNSRGLNNPCHCPHCGIRPLPDKWRASYGLASVNPCAPLLTIL